MMATILVAVALCSAPKAGGQCVSTQAGPGSGDIGAIGMLQEVGGVLVEENGKLRFLMVMPSGQRPETYRSVDLEQDDILLMFNGKRFKAIADLTTAYEALKPGDEMKLGIRRGVSMRIVSMVKASSDDLPKMKTMIMTAESDKEDASVTTGATGDGEPLTVLVEGGLVAKDDEGTVIVAMLMPHAKDILGSVEVHRGDRFISLQGEEVTSAGMLGEVFDAIKTGEMVKLVFERDGEQFAASFEKPEAQSQPHVIIKKQ